LLGQPKAPERTGLGGLASKRGRGEFGAVQVED
jgi:hypothetical protein